jgi:outer membrane protein OmpA-like peptidoglycan-associated protein
MNRIFLIAFLVCSNIGLQAQTPRNLLPRVINLPDRNHISPSLSGDGKHMVFVSNYTLNNRMLLKYTYLDDNNQWTDPVEMNSINRADLDFVGGHWLSYDGSLLFFTSKRSPSIGKYDIFYSERNGTYWSPPQNIGKPINSNGNEGHPSLSPDGRFLYFMRCKEMDNYKADGCELYVAERRSENYWHEPVKLPYPINTGNEATPRILPDGESLMFASKRPGGKGGFDLYLSRMHNGQWSNPVACDYLNTEDDDQFVSIPAHGNLAYYSARFRGFFNIIEAQIPDHLKPKKVVLAHGKVVEAGSNKPLNTVLQVYNARTKERDQFIRTKPDGTFFVLIKGDDIYDFSIITRENKHVYFSRLYDIDQLENSKIENLSIELEPIKDGLVFVAEDIEFKPSDITLKKESEIALLRLAKFMNDNPNMVIEIAVYPDKNESSPQFEDPFPEEEYINSIQHDGFNNAVDINPDEQNFLETEWGKDDPSPNGELRLTLSNHNNLTARQAQALVDELIGMGVQAHRMTAKGHGDKNNLDDLENSWVKNGGVEIKIIHH